MRRLLAMLRAASGWLLLLAICRGQDCPCPGSSGGDFVSLCQSSQDRECCDCICDCQRFLGMLPSDHCFDDFISPISNPFFFEDPRALTEVRGIFLNNNLPGDIGGANGQLWAVQLRGRLTEQVSVIAPRIGYWHIVPGGNDSPAGFMAAPVGFKYSLIRDVERQFLLSGGATYFIPGGGGSYTNFGDGDFHFFLTGGKQIFDRGHWISGSGFRIPANNNWGTQLWYWSNQWDYEIARDWYPLIGVNWFHWMNSSAQNLTNGITGLDLVNLPTAGVAGHNVVTSVVGLKWKPSGHLEVGAGYEFPLTANGDILNNRIYADVIFRY